MVKKQLLMQKMHRYAAGIFAVAVLMSALFVGTAVTASAAAYSGSGTQADPYIVETAQQLDGMRDNLSAHYKLGNTIDMSAFGKFTPIGWQGTPFTGSFVCDTNKDGTPKFAIKNLTVYNDAGERYGHKLGSNEGYVDFSQGKCKWQAGLFGFTQGATLTNIAVLNADITNTVIGQNNMNKDFSLNSGMDSQGTGILVGMAVGTNISGCVSSGKVNSKSNSTGGLIGDADETTSIAYCYSTAEVTSSGYWNTGGLVGSCGGSLSCSFATGDVKGGATEPTTGSLTGGMGSTSTVSSCYATGEVLSDSNGHNFIGFDNGKDVPDGMYYCYFTGSVKGYSSFDNAGVTAADQHLYALKGAAGRQSGYTTASADEIKSAFSASADWDVSGKLPTLKNVHIIEDESKYVPTQGGSNSGDTQTSSTSQAAGSSSSVTSDTAGNTSGQSNTGSSKPATSSQAGTQSSSQQAASSGVGNTSQAVTSSSVASSGAAENTGSATEVDVTELVEKMNALPIEDDIKLEHYETIFEIKQQYESLSDEQLSNVSIEALKKYNAAVSAVIPLVMADITKQVNELPDVEDLTGDDYERVMALKEKFEFIGDNAEFMEETVTEKLSAAITKVEELGEPSQSESSSNGITLIEWILIGVICLFIVCALTVEVIWTYQVCKKTKALKNDLEIEE